MDDCIFCKIIRGEVPSSKVYENEHVFAFLDIHPANPYHTLIIPKTHYRDIFEIPESALCEVTAIIGQLAKLYKEKLGITNVQIINSSGSEAQQDVFHLHFHLVPRHSGDGQDIAWTTHPELREQFTSMLAKLQ